MTAKIDIKPGTNEVLIDVGRSLGKHRVGLKLALNDIGSEVVNETVRFIKNGPKTGRIYTVRGARHQASSPGESPALRTGRLARSADYIVRNFQEMTVGESASYAGFLEDGTRNMDPRPHLIRAVRSKARDTERTILDSVEREINS